MPTDSLTRDSVVPIRSFSSLGIEASGTRLRQDSLSEDPDVMIFPLMQKSREERCSATSDYLRNGDGMEILNSNDMVALRYQTASAAMLRTGGRGR
jgi:hypothetical protein